MSPKVAGFLSLEASFGESPQRVAASLPFQPHFVPWLFLAHSLTFLCWGLPGPGVSWIIRKEQKGMSQKNPEIGMGKEESQMLMKQSDLPPSKERPQASLTRRKAYRRRHTLA